MTGTVNLTAFYLGNKNDDAGKSGTTANAVTVTIKDNDSDGYIREKGGNGPGDLINGELIDTFKHNSTLEVGGVTYTGWYVAYKDSNGHEELYFVPTDGNVPVTGTLDADVDLDGDQWDECIPCFTPGTMIVAKPGLVPIETLSVGEKVLTRDNGFQEIRWIGTRSIPHSVLRSVEKTRPIIIRKGAMGGGLPVQDLMLSPNHRVLINNEKLRWNLGLTEALGSSKHLVHNQGVMPVLPDSVTYIHMMFDRHELVLSNGLWSESFCPTIEPLNGVDQEHREEIFSLFPELKEQASCKVSKLVRPAIRRYEAMLV
ncbi:MAG: Hint domain-containing protein [Rhodobacteraceae bacterium]|nr:Hint domain-containing protein [Paracoccaceae bacterium]